MADLFKEIIPSIMSTKKMVLDDEKSYVPFIVNKALSFHYDAVLYANEMNKNHSLDNKLQYLYLLNTVRGWKRPFQKWLKRETIEDLECIKEYYGYSDQKAKDALRVLSSSQIDAIKNNLRKGGVNNDKSQRIGRGKNKTG